jgi:hypothetical protein
MPDAIAGPSMVANTVSANNASNPGVPVNILGGTASPVSTSGPNFDGNSRGSYFNSEGNLVGSVRATSIVGDISAGNGGYLGQTGIWDTGYSGTTLYGGVNETILRGGISTTFTPDDGNPTTLIGGVDKTFFPPDDSTIPALKGGAIVISTPPPPPPPDVKQVVKIDVSNNVIQPAEPCRTIPYLKLVFRPKDPNFKFERDLRRETIIPFPKPLNMTVTEFKNQFAGKIHTLDTKYMIRWKQLLPTIIESQDDTTLNFKGAENYDFRTSLLANTDLAVNYVDISEFPIYEVFKGTYTKGPTTQQDSHELQLDDVLYADLNQSTGMVQTKDPIEAGIFTGA